MRRAGACASRSPRSSSGSITFSSAVNAGNSWKLWNTKPTLAPRTRARPSSSSCDSATPSRRTTPVLGVSSPASNDSSVLLPEPDAPTTATASPAPMVKLTSSRIVSSWSGRRTRLPSCSATRAPALVEGGDSARTSVMAGTFAGGMDMEHGVRRRWLQRAIGHAVAALALAIVPVVPATAVEKPARTVLVVGDSLAAAYGLSSPDLGWVALLGARVGKDKPGWQVRNASISGDTTAGGAARIVAELKRTRPAVVVIELGANDGLRGLSPAQTRVNLARMIGAAHGAGARVLLVGMRMPPNLGPT